MKVYIKCFYHFMVSAVSMPGGQNLTVTKICLLFQISRFQFALQPQFSYESQGKSLIFHFVRMGMTISQHYVLWLKPETLILCRIKAERVVLIFLVLQDTSQKRWLQDTLKFQFNSCRNTEVFRNLFCYLKQCQSFLTDFW